MSDYIKIGLKILWSILLLYWGFSAIVSKKNLQQENMPKQFALYWLPLLVAVYLLGPGEWFGRTWLREKFVPHSDFVGLIGLACCTLGVIIACWSRYLLGRNWSLSVQKKEDHELISTGPYRLVRHPIYSGLLLLFTGNALIVGDYRGLIAILIVLVSFWFKLKKEEAWLTEVFGTRYTDYMKNSKAIIPFII